MDFLTPPTAALENLTITDSHSPPTTALNNLTISGRNTEKNKPRMQNHIKPSRTLSREGSFRLAHLCALIRQWYGPLKTSKSCIRLEDPSTPHSYNNIVSPEERINQLRLHASKRLSNREGFKSLRLMYIRRRIAGELSNMAENKAEHREKLELAKSYVQQRKNQEEVLSIIRSVYTNCYSIE